MGFNFYRFLYIFSISILTIPLFAKPPKELILERSPIKMVAEGIEFLPFDQFKPIQIPPLESSTLSRKESSGEEKITAYDYNELWFRGQLIASYQNAAAKVEFHKLNYLPPENVTRLYGNLVTEAEFKKNIINSPQDEKFILAWFKQFTKQEIKLEDKYPKVTLAIQQKWVEMGQKAGEYDFLLQSADNRLFYLKCTLQHSDKNELESIIKNFIKSIKINRPQEVKATNQSTKVKPKGTASAEFLETVEKVKQEVANSEGWWYAQTPNYILKSNLPAKSKTFAKNVQERVEIMRKAYESFIPPMDEISAVSVIAIPATREEYIKYSEAPAWSAGVWSSARRELIISLLDDRDKKTAEIQMMNTLHHEAFHQYIYYALNEVRTPAWFNEGHADMFSSVKITGSIVKVIEDPYALRALDSYFKSGKIDLNQHINSSYEEFYAKKELNYPLSWALIYFLRKAGDQYKVKKYEQIIPKLISSLVESKSVEVANKMAFQDIDIKILEKDFLEFWSNKSARAKAEKNDIISK